MKLPPLSLRTKLILSFLAVIAFGGLISLVIGWRLVKNTLIGQAQLKVKHDLSAAWMVFNERLNNVKDLVNLTAARESLQLAVQEGQADVIFKYLDRVRRSYALDFLTLTDAHGQVVVRSSNPHQVGDNQASDELVSLALAGTTVASPQILSAAELQKERPELARRARMKILPTPKAAPRQENIETRGLVLKAAAPLINDQDRTLGALYGGILLNRNYEIVDRVKEIVYKDEKYKGREIGTATIFQHDLRISTNVRNQNGGRAIGTRVSAEVSQAVLVKGQPWIDRAFVVNDWYITAYEPIHNLKGEIIGILYVGMLEKPYLDTTNRLMLTFTGMASLCVVVLLILLYFSTTRIIHPLQEMVTATQRIAEGDLSHKVEVTSADEIGQLASSFNAMVDKLQAANQKLIEWGRTLEKKVEERTRELTAMQAHLIRSEKLASLGKLAAGIAHEINNPLGGILIYSHLILEDTDKNSPHYENLKKIVKETARCKDIVKRLLEFARPREPEFSLLNINEIVEKSLSIVERQALFQNIKIIKRYDSHLPKTVADGAQLQQVFTNIIINAAEAMDGQGTLTIQTATVDNNLHISFTDTGHGISEEDKKRIFEPFFTTKEVGKGTGLGLAISYSIIQKHHGTIEVVSQRDRGATFIVKIPVRINQDE